jgi:hypothetical protein
MFINGVIGASIKLETAFGKMFLGEALLGWNWISVKNVDTFSSNFFFDIFLIQYPLGRVLLKLMQ